MAERSVQLLERAVRRIERDRRRIAWLNATETELLKAHAMVTKRSAALLEQVNAALLELRDLRAAITSVNRAP